MSLEDQTRRQLEQAAAEQQVQPSECPVEGDIDAALGMVTPKTKVSGGKKGGRVGVNQGRFGATTNKAGRWFQTKGSKSQRRGNI